MTVLRVASHSRAVVLLSMDGRSHGSSFKAPARVAYGSLHVRANMRVTTLSSVVELDADSYLFSELRGHHQFVDGALVKACWLPVSYLVQTPTPIIHGLGRPVMHPMAAARSQGDLS